jgi:ubiquinone/menaquinone biosynthesis C-methylase UbiE
MTFRPLRWFAAAMLLVAAPALAGQPDIDGYANTGVTLDGIGRSYMGRQIAHVMGHEAADWLDRPERDKEEGSTRLVPLLGLKPTDAVADIGAGTGYFTFRMSAAVPAGKVYAVDIQPEMLDVIKARQTKTVGANIITIQGSIADPRLPAAGIDLILLVDAYHEFSYPREMGLAMARALKPGGRIALVEYRGEDPKVPIKDMHRMTEAQAKKEMTVLGLTWQRTDESLPWQHVMFFAKPAAP